MKLLGAGYAPVMDTCGEGQNLSDMLSVIDAADPPLVAAAFAAAGLDPAQNLLVRRVEQERSALECIAEAIELARLARMVGSPRMGLGSTSTHTGLIVAADGGDGPVWREFHGGVMSAYEMARAVVWWAHSQCLPDPAASAVIFEECLER